MPSRVQLFAIPWAAARQASLPFTISWSLLKLRSTECHPSSASSVIPFSSCGVLQILLLASSPSSSFGNLFNVHSLGPHSELTESNTHCCCCCSAANSCPTLWPHGLQPGSSVLHYLPEFAQIHVHWVVMLSNHLILCCSLLLCLQSFPASESFQ